jgi:hypothetical protein
MTFSNRRDVAVHEAAHAVVGHEVGGTVLSVDIGGGPEKSRRASINWSIDPATLAKIDWLNEAESEKALAAVREIITCLVAGEVAEKEFKPDMQLLSHRINDVHFAHGGKIGADRDTLVWLLCQVQRPDIAEVRQAEERAKAILVDREARMKAIADRLVTSGYIEGEELSAALNL